MGRLCSKQRTLYCLHGRVAALLGALAYGGGRDCPRSIAAISAAGTNVAAPPSRVAEQQHRELSHAPLRLSQLQHAASRTQSVAHTCR